MAIFGCVPTPFLLALHSRIKVLVQPDQLSYAVIQDSSTSIVSLTADRLNHFCVSWVWWKSANQSPAATWQGATTANI